MDTNEVVEQLRSLTYLPGWTFDVHPVSTLVDQTLWRVVYRLSTEPGDVVLLVHFEAPESSDPPGQEALVELARPLVLTPRDFGSAEDLEDAVTFHLATVQLHELAELVKWGGRAPFHPHRLDGRRRLRALAAERGNPLLPA